MALLSFARRCCSGEAHSMSLAPVPPLARVQKHHCHRAELPSCRLPGQHGKKSSGPWDKQVPGASPESEGSEPQPGGSGLQPAPNPVYS